MINTLEAVINFITNKDAINSSSNYLNDLAKFIGDLLAVDYLLVNKYANENNSLVETITIYTKNGFVPNFTYPLKGTPCQNVFGAQFCSYETDVQQLFPEDELLSEMDIESYVGAPLYDANNQQIGILIVMNKGRMEHIKDVELALKAVSVTAGIELERRILKSKLQISENRFNQLLESSDDMITIHNLQGKFLYYNNPSSYPISPSAIIGKMPEDLLDQNTADHLKETFRKVVKTGASETSEIRYAWSGKKRWFFEYIYPIKDEQGEAIELVRICKDIQERKIEQEKFERKNQELIQREKELQASNEEYQALNEELNHKNEEFRTLLKSNEKHQAKLKELYNTLNQAQKLSNIGSWQWNMLTDEAEWSDQMYNIYGVDKKDFYPSNENVVKTVLKEDYPKFEQGLGVLMEDKIFTPFEFRIKRPSGEVRTLYIIALEKGTQGSDTENIVFGVTQDVTERKLAEQSFHHFAQIASNSSDLIFLTDLNLKFLAVNKSFLIAHGYDAEDVLGKTLPEIMGFSDEYITEFIKPNIEKCMRGEPVTYQRWYDFPNKGKRYMDIKYTNFNEPETNTTGIVFNSRDITLRKQAEDKIKDSLEEKELLLRELYHRTKNNMQVISSMLAMRAMYTDNEEVKVLLSETKSKILGMALVHEKLYQANDLSKINLKNYLEDLIQLLKNNLLVSNQNIKVETTLENIDSNIDTAIPCGMVVNEIFTNALKHAFLPGKKGMLEIKLHRDDESKINLVISDNGKGLPDDFDIHHCKSYGLQSVVMLTKLQLGGTIQMKNNDGTEFILRFKESMSRDGVYNE